MQVPIDINIKEAIQKAIGSDKPIHMLGIDSQKFPMAFKMNVRFDTKLAPRSLMTKDIRFHNPQWGDDSTFRHPIEYLEFYLPVPYKILLSGMEEYNFFIEAMGGLNTDRLVITSFWFCGHLPGTNEVTIWKVNVNGVIEKSQSKKGKEYNGTSSSGWRKGTPNKNPMSQIVQF